MVSVTKCPFRRCVLACGTLPPRWYPSARRRIALTLPPNPTTHLFSGERVSLLELLPELTPDDWNAPTVCDGWNAHHVALHLIGGDIGWLTSGRDRIRRPSTATPVPGLSAWHTLVGWIDARNAGWVDATRRVSPALLIDLLAIAADRPAAWLPELDLDAPGISVDWVGPGPAPAWLHVAREYTERWMHPQHIRDAVGNPGLTEPEWQHPVLDTFAHALSHMLREIDTSGGATATRRIAGPADGAWSVRREGAGWLAPPGSLGNPDTLVTIDEDTAWRDSTRSINLVRVRARTEVAGDAATSETILRKVPIVP